MSRLTNLCPGDAASPTDMDAILGLCTRADENGVSSWDLTKVAFCDGAVLATVESLDIETLLGLCMQLKEAGDAANAPTFFTIAMTARASGGTAAVTERHQKQALCQSLVEYLWRCCDHGHLRVASGTLVLPSPCAQPATSIPPATSAPPAATGNGTTSSDVDNNRGATDRLEGGGDEQRNKRRLEELVDAVETLSERQSLAEGLRQKDQDQSPTASGL